jgi:hypothetical protein
MYEYFWILCLEKLKAEFYMYNLQFLGVIEIKIHDVIKTAGKFQVML